MKTRKNNRILIGLVIFLVLFLVSFFWAGSAVAADGSAANNSSAASSSGGSGWNRFIVADIASWLVSPLVSFVGELLSLVVSILLAIIKYNNFVDALPVVTGWVIIRDLCNMGFVVIILIVALGTTLNIQSYSFRVWLPKLILMAILINFSKAIAGFFIDISQIIMLTFATGIENMGAGSFHQMLSIQRFLNVDFSNLSEETRKNMGLTALLVTILLALVMALVALIVVGSITIILIIRIVAIWILVVLSPFAYLFSASPVGRQYASQWWSSFFKWLFTGPVMLFFIWLGLSTVNQTIGMFLKNNAPETSMGIAALGTPVGIGTMLIGSAFLMAALIVGQQLGGMAGKAASWGYAKITQTLPRLARKGTTGAADWVNRKQARFTGQDLNLKRRWGIIRQAMSEAKKEDLDRIYERADSFLKGEESKKTLGSFILGSGSKAWYDNYVKSETFGLAGGIYRAIKGSFTKRDLTKEEEEKKREIEKLQEKEKELDSQIKEKEEKIKLYEMDPKEKQEKIRNYSEQVNQVESEIKEKEKENKNLEEAIHDLTKTLGEIGEAEYTKDKKGKVILKSDIEKELKKKEAEQDKTKKELIELGKKKQNLEKEKERWEEIKNISEKKVEEEKESLKELHQRRDAVLDTIEAERRALEKIRREEVKGQIDDIAIKRDRWIRRRKEEGSMDFQDSSEGEAIFDKATEEKNQNKASAVLIHLAKRDDLNDILLAKGYNTHTVGLTEEEVEEIKEEITKLGRSLGKNDREIQRDIENALREKRGLHDFIRDYFVKKMGVSKQIAYELEAELGGILKSRGQLYASDAVKLKRGKYEQVPEKERAVQAVIHANKTTNPVQAARNASRHFFGGENYRGEYVFGAFGLKEILGSFEAYRKQIKEGRFKGINAIKFSEPQAIEQLKKAGEKMLPKDKLDDFYKFLEELQEYAKTKNDVEESVEDIRKLER